MSKPEILIAKKTGLNGNKPKSYVMAIFFPCLESPSLGSTQLKPAFSSSAEETVQQLSELRRWCGSWVKQISGLKLR